MFPVHAPSFIGRQPVDFPVFQSSNTAQEASPLTVWKKDVQFDNDAGGNQLLIALYMTNGFIATHLAPTYNGAFGTVHAQQSVSDIITTNTVSVSYWKDGQLPSSPGMYEFKGSHTGVVTHGQAVRMLLLKDVDQTTPLGTIIGQIKTRGLTPFTMSDTILSQRGKGAILMACAATSSATYVSGDIRDNGSNMNNLVEQIVPDPSVPGAAMVTADDIIPDTTEKYEWTISYGVTNLIEAAQTMIIPINGDAA